MIVLNKTFSEYRIREESSLPYLENASRMISDLLLQPPSLAGVQALLAMVC